MHLGVPVYKPTKLLISFSCIPNMEKKTSTEYEVLVVPMEVYPRENKGWKKNDSLHYTLQAYKK